MLHVALTGGIATGKSYVRRALEQHGVPTIDADTLAREVVAPGTPGLQAVVERFGPGVLDSNGALDRSRLGQLVFADVASRRDLEAIIHPRVYEAIESWFHAQRASGAALGVADIPLLFETKRVGIFDFVIVVACSPALQLARVQARDGLSEEQARRRIDAQWPITEKERLADFVVRTDGTFEETDRQVLDLRKRLLRLVSRTG
ncbi:MAG: dephospho-CoA kinase [Vicinamibacterales bacterium]